MTSISKIFSRSLPNYIGCRRHQQQQQQQKQHPAYARGPGHAGRSALDSTALSSHRNFHNQLDAMSQSARQQRMLRISIEGNIGSGKSSVIEQLKRRLAESKEIHEPLRSLKANALNASEKFVLANKSNENGAKVDMATCVNGNVHCEDTHCADFFTQPFVSVKIIPEPVDKWRNLNGNNLLDLMYTDPVRWSFAFQSYVQLTLLESHLEMNNTSNVHEYGGGANDKSCLVRIMERSIFSAKYCFIENMSRGGLLHPVESDILHKWFEWMTSNHSCQLDVVFYLRVEPDVCMQRLQKRGRQEEIASINVDYLQRLHDLYDAWLLGAPTPHATTKYKRYRPASVVVIDARKSVQEIYELIESETRNVSSHLACLEHI